MLYSLSMFRKESQSLSLRSTYVWSGLSPCQWCQRPFSNPGTPQQSIHLCQKNCEFYLKNIELHRLLSILDIKLKL